MVTEKELKEARERWHEHCLYVSSMTEISQFVTCETPAQKAKRIKRLRGHYDEFCEYYFPHYLTQRDPKTNEIIKVTHNAPFHNAAAREIFEHETWKAVYMWPRGHAKSTHLGIFIPSFLMFQEISRIHVGLYVNKSEDGAITLLSDLQAELEYNKRLIADFGKQKVAGSWEGGEFVTSGGVSWFALGRGQSPRGLRKQQARPDYILIDDLDDDEMSRNESRVQECTEWAKTALFGATDVGRGRFIMVGNLISKCSVLANIAANPSVHVSRIDALDKNGEPTWRDKWTKEEAEEYARFSGYAGWQKEMMNNPIQQGGIFHWEWIRYKKILPLVKYDDIVVYVDPSLKSTRKSDYKAVRVWGKKSRELHLIDCFVRQATLSEMVRWMYNFYEDLPDRAMARFYIEANFWQDIILDEFTAEGDARGYQLPIMPDKRKKPDKLQRIEAVSPLWERGFVFYNEELKNSPDMVTGIEQTLAIAHGSSAHDDAPDADEGAIYLLQRSSRTESIPTSFGRRPSPKTMW